MRKLKRNQEVTDRLTSQEVIEQNENYMEVVVYSMINSRLI